MRTSAPFLASLKTATAKRLRAKSKLRLRMDFAGKPSYRAAVWVVRPIMCLDEYIPDRAYYHAWGPHSPSSPSRVAVPS